MRILDLPPEIFLHIFSYNNDVDLSIASQVCRDWKALATDNRLWIVFVENDNLASFILDQPPPPPPTYYQRREEDYYEYHRSGSQGDPQDVTLKKQQQQKQQPVVPKLHSLYCQNKINTNKRNRLILWSVTNAASLLIFINPNAFLERLLLFLFSYHASSHLGLGFFPLQRYSFEVILSDDLLPAVERYFIPKRVKRISRRVLRSAMLLIFMVSSLVLLPDTRITRRCRRMFKRAISRVSLLSRYNSNSNRDNQESILMAALKYLWILLLPL